MHELSICEALIEQVERVAREHGGRRVVSIVVAVGPLAGVEPRLLEHAYPLAAAGTCADSAELRLELVPVRVRCRTCTADSVVESNRLVCVQCGDWRVDVTSGDELLLQRVELEAVEPARERSTN